MRHYQTYAWKKDDATLYLGTGVGIAGLLVGGTGALISAQQPNGGFTFSGTSDAFLGVAGVGLAVWLGAIFLPSYFSSSDETAAGALCGGSPLDGSGGRLHTGGRDALGGHRRANRRPVRGRPGWPVLERANQCRRADRFQPGAATRGVEPLLRRGGRAREPAPGACPVFVRCRPGCATSGSERELPRSRFGPRTPSRAASRRPGPRRCAPASLKGASRDTTRCAAGGGAQPEDTRVWSRLPPELNHGFEAGAAPGECKRNLESSAQEGLFNTAASASRRRKTRTATVQVCRGGLRRSAGEPGRGRSRLHRVREPLRGQAGGKDGVP